MSLGAAAQPLLGKYRELRALISMARWFENWSEICASRRLGRELPPLRLRRGLVLQHRPEDLVLLQVGEVMGEGSYRRLIEEPAGGTIIDIGANIGVAVLDWASRLRGVHVHAYEPHPATFAVLIANVEANRLAARVETYQQAVGPRRGTLMLKSTAVSTDSSAYETVQSSDALDKFEVTMVPLDEAVARCPAEQPIRLVKIDTEGAEADILEGAAPATLQRISQVVLEYHHFAVPDALERCTRVLSSAGFRCHVHPDRTRAQLGLLYARREPPPGR